MNAPRRAVYIESFENYMARGKVALQRHDFKTAFEQFYLAVNTPPAGDNPDGMSEALQMMGVCFRMQKMYRLAKKILVEALDSTETDLQRGKVCRDIGMLYLDAPELGDAEFWLEQSFELLSEGAPADETGITLGFIGRLKFERRDQRGAVADMRVADHLTVGNPVYRANNIVWLMRASVKERWRRLPRAIWLTVAYPDNWVRFKEVIIVVLLGDRGYTALKKKFA